MNRPTSMILLLALATSACAQMPPRTAAHEPQVVAEAQTHSVRFVFGSAALVPGEAERLQAFLNQVGVRRGDVVMVEQPAEAGDLARVRYATLADRLTRDGFRPGVRAWPDPSPENLRVMVEGAATASVPGCPDWNQPATATFNNGLASNFGCATAANLAATVASPTDLAKGREPSPAQARAEPRRPRSNGQTQGSSTSPASALPGSGDNAPGRS